MRLTEAYSRYHAKNAALWALLGRPAPSWPVKRWWEKLRYGEQALGLRTVGHVVPEGSPFRGLWMVDKDVGKLGWLTDPDGFTYKDGEGLCWGVVLQIPGKNGKARLLAGYRFGGFDDWTTIDRSTVYEADMRGTFVEHIQNTDAAIAAAREADRLAQNAAEEEQEYQRQHREDDEDESS